ASEDREAFRSGHRRERPRGARLLRRRRAPRDVDENGFVAFDRRIGDETFRPVGPPARVEREPPAMIAADEVVAVDFPLAKQRGPMRAPPLEGAPARTGPDEDDVMTVRGN